MNGMIDLHMHTTVSDGTDTPAEIIGKVKKAGIGLFSVTDHDAVKGGTEVLDLLKEGDPAFITGAEFSCKDELGRYHILGYGYEPDAEAIHELVAYGHRLRLKKVTARLDFLKSEFGFDFPEEALRELFALDNPGKPHIGNLMVKYGFAATKEEAILRYINKLHVRNSYVRPEEAIEGILAGGGIPVLAHPVFGSGDETVRGEELRERVRRLMGFGLQGMECFYSRYTEEMREECLAIAESNGLYVTAGSDYHGTNKTVALGNTGLIAGMTHPDGLERFLSDVRISNT